MITWQEVKRKALRIIICLPSGNWLNPSKFFGHGVSTFKKDIMQWLPESVCPSFNTNRWEENKNPQ